MHPTASKMVLQDGLLPPWIIYHEFVETSKPFLRHVCAIEADWVVPTLKKLQESDAQALSKATSNPSRRLHDPTPISDSARQTSTSDEPQRAGDLTIAAAKARALVRRQAAASKIGNKSLSRR